MTSTDFQNRPWTPVQVVAMSVIFGILAAGAITGINLRRMDKPGYMWPCIFIGLILFLAETYAFVFLIPEDFLNVAGLSMNFIGGLGFMLVMQPHFSSRICLFRLFRMVIGNVDRDEETLLLIS